MKIDLNHAVLVVVDAQRGFTTLCPQELPVPGGLKIVPAVNQLLALPWARIDATQDWHPPDHCSFLGQTHNIYPPHCVMNTPGADFCRACTQRSFTRFGAKVFSKRWKPTPSRHNIRPLLVHSVPPESRRQSSAVSPPTSVASLRHAI